MITVEWRTWSLFMEITIVSKELPLMDDSSNASLGFLLARSALCIENRMNGYKLEDLVSGSKFIV